MGTKRTSRCTLLSMFMCLVASGIWLAGSWLARAQERPSVDLALVLSIDCSYSVDSEEFALQTRGTAWALQQPDILKAIQSGRHKRIAIALVQWSGVANQTLALDWTLIESAEDAAAAAAKISSMPRYLAHGSTSINGMMKFAARVLGNAPVKASRQVIDISADGRNNAGGYTRPLRDALIAYGITLNGLAILNEIPTLKYYFQREVIGGLGSFVIAAESYEDFRIAIHRKLLREIIGPGVS
ncbi:MAG: DUF1194 domain-containing protein [Hyphomicrobiales bacterium]